MLICILRNLLELFGIERSLNILFNFYNFSIFCFRSAISKVTGDDFDCIECKNSLYITVSNVYLLSSQIPRLLEILSNYLKVKQLTNQHYVSLTMCQPRGIVSTLMYPGKSTSKYYTNSRQTLLYKLDNSYSSLITKTQ